MTVRAWGYFGAVSILWGIPYLFIAVAVRELPPATVAFARSALGALLLLPIALFAGALRELGARALPLTFLAALEIAVPFLLISKAQTVIASSLTGILVATVPLFVALLALWFDPSERATGWRLGGLTAGLVGVIVLLGIDVRGVREELLGGIMVLGASLSYAGGALFVKRAFRDANPVGVATGTLAAGALLLAGPVLLTTEAGDLSPSGPVVGSLLALGLLSSGLAFWLWYALVREAGASRASIITYVAPGVAVLAGVVVLDESVTAATAVGLLLISGGSWLSTRGATQRGDASPGGRRGGSRRGARASDRRQR